VLDERHAGRLGDERHGARRARVRLQDVDAATVQRQLQVEQAARTQRPRGGRDDVTHLIHRCA